MINGAMCVQRFDDSLNSAIRITYRISLRSSSLREPRYPLLTVVWNFLTCTAFAYARSILVVWFWLWGENKSRWRNTGRRRIKHPASTLVGWVKWFTQLGIRLWIRVNDPSAGSPTETLLRLLLPLNDKV